MAGVPHDRVLGAVELAVKRECQLDHAEVGREVAACPGRLLDEECAHLFGKLRQLGLVEAAEVGGRVDRFENGHPGLNARALP